MEDNFNQNDFEEFLKEEVRNHRMYPNDAVWRDINKKLHGDRKWPALTIAAFTLLSATIAISVYFTPKPDVFTTNPSFTTNSSNNELKNSTLLNTQHNIGLNNMTIDMHKDQAQATASASSNISAVNAFKTTDQNTPVGVKEKEDKKDIAHQQNKVSLESRGNQKLYNAHVAVNAKTEVSNDIVNVQLPIIHPKNATTSNVIKPLAEKPKVAKDYNDKNMVDNFLKDHKSDVALHTVSKIKRLKNRFGFQIYVAPSVSYRKLIEDRSILKEGTNPGPVGLNYVADVNKVVRHKPGNGLEAGVSIMYYLSDNFRVKSGFQFNVRQYSIEAYRSSTEVASIALVENNRIDTTITTLAIYRNNNGYYPTELINRYYQFSIPIGVEWEIIGNRRMQLNVAASIQPTYLINHNAYLLSTNFKNYTENPDMVRSFNINSNIETYISFKAGNFKWQIGPQLRYQPYSTFIPQYPIKEHLLDYGIKLGLSKTF